MAHAWTFTVTKITPSTYLNVAPAPCCRHQGRRARQGLLGSRGTAADGGQKLIHLVARPRAHPTAPDANHKALAN